jgi:hypothetical protein
VIGIWYAERPNQTTCKWFSNAGNWPGLGPINAQRWRKLENNFRGEAEMLRFKRIYSHEMLQRMHEFDPKKDDTYSLSIRLARRDLDQKRNILLCYENAKIEGDVITVTLQDQPFVILEERPK